MLQGRECLVILAFGVRASFNFPNMVMVEQRTFGGLSDKEHHMLCRLEWAKSWGKVGLRQLVMHKPTLRSLKKKGFVTYTLPVKAEMKTHQVEVSLKQVVQAS